MWSCRIWSPNPFTSWRTLMTASLSTLLVIGCPPLMSDPYDREDDGKGGVEDDHQEHGFDHGSRREPADAGGVALDLQTLITTDQGDNQRKDGRLDDADEECVERDRVLQLSQEHRQRDVQIEVAHDCAPDHSHDVSVESEEGKCDHQSYYAWQDERVDRVDADRLHGIEFFVHAHRADLRRECRSRTSGDNDRGDQSGDLAQQTNAKKVDGEDFGAKTLELVGTLIGKDDP